MIFDEQYGEKLLQITSGVCFTSRMKKELSKLSFEYQALAVLRLVFGEKIIGFTRDDAPDLQNRATKTGIEVVTSHKEQLHRVENYEKILLDYRKSGLHEDAERIKNLIMDKEQFRMIGDTVLYPANPNIETNTFLNAVYAKTKKINEYKAKGFVWIGLFVWHLSPIVGDMIKDLPTEWSSLLKDADCFFESKFDFIIVTAENRVILFGSNYEAQTIEIPKNIFSILPTLGRMAAEGMIENDIWFWNL